jgi:hypothetical protein
MFLVFDTFSNAPDFDQYGHVKVYSTEKAARRAVSRQNSAAAPAYPGEKFRRWAVAPVTLRLQYDQGRPVTL